MSDIPALDVLAIAAHPDDVEQTCGGTLIKMAELGERTGVLISRPGIWARADRRRFASRSPRRRRATCCWPLGATCASRRAVENVLAARMSLAAEIRRLRPRVVILPYWEARHPDHYRAGEIGYEACFLAGLKKLDESSAPHRPFKVVYSSLYAT